MNKVRGFVCVVGFVLLSFTPSWAQKLNGIEKEEAQGMLKRVAEDVRKHYYDPTFHGVDWDAKVQETKAKIDNAPSMNAALSNIAGLLDSLNDSHTVFIPPPRPYRLDYGYRAQMIGEHCLITRIRPKTDAEAKGVKPGDELLGIEGYAVSARDLDKMEYVYNVLRPKGSLHLTLRNLAGEERDVDVQARMKETQRITDFTGEAAEDSFWNEILKEQKGSDAVATRYTALDDLMIVRMAEFGLTETQVEGLMDIARKHKNLIIDLRGNGGGSIETLRALVGGVFDHEVKIADQVWRDKSKDKPLMSKFNYKKSFPGKVTVLVDSRSASCSELFARVIQLEKRGAVLGDHTSGKVMQSKLQGYTVGAGTIVRFASSITESNLIMTDGKSLENVGVTPDQMMLPSIADLASGKDPVLAKAAQDLGVNLTAEAAGKVFPFEWPED